MQLVKLSVARQLPQELALEVQGLRVRWDNWNDALAAEELRAIKRVRNAENN